ncbi:OmpA family protein [bacterium]|nr:OmpA family protein [bacterium]
MEKSFNYSTRTQKSSEILKESRNKNKDTERIRISRHTDNVPIGSKCLYSSNLKLSQARAHTVFQALIKDNNLSAEAFSVKSFGKIKTTASKKTSSRTR